jgi:hypothetical protein
MPPQVGPEGRWLEFEDCRHQSRLK